MSKKNRGPVFDRVDAGGEAARGRRAKRTDKTGAAGTAASEIAASEIAPTPTAPTDPLFALALEPRLLLDAAAVATAVETADDGSADGGHSGGAAPDDGQADPKAAGDDLAAKALDASGGDGGEIVFIDTGVADWQTLADGVDPSAEVVLVGPDEDGMQVMADTLAGRSNVSAVHVLSHGDVGVFELGSARVNSSALTSYTDELATIRGSLADEADLLLYGCYVGADGTGITFVKDLVAATGADVAASDDLTGSPKLNADWNLEFNIGSVNTIVLDFNYAFTSTLNFNFTTSLSAGANPLSAIPNVPEGVVTGDFDSDGDLDVLAYDDNTYTSFSYYENNGSGGFSKQTGNDDPFDGIADSKIFFSQGRTFVADFDNDGDDDIWDYVGSSGNSIYLKQPDSPNNAPVFDSLATASAAENTGLSTVVLDVNADDGDGGGNDVDVTYSITGGVDLADFNIDAHTGELTFVSSPVSGATPPHGA